MLTSPCHFLLSELASHLENINGLLYKLYVPKANQTSNLSVGVRKHYTLLLLLPPVNNTVKSSDRQFAVDTRDLCKLMYFI